MTLVSPDGEYGGPLRVAVNQCAVLRKHGHDVTIGGSFRGFRSAPSSIEGIPAKLFPANLALPRSGFAGLASPRLWVWLARSASQFDVIHIHLARDLVTLPAAWIVSQRGVRYVVQTHGMIDESGHALSRPLDALLTLPVLHRAHRVLYLTSDERTDLEKVAGRDSMAMMAMPNGVPCPEFMRVAPSSIEVLYLARLAARKRPLAFVRAAEALRSEFPNVRFTLVGPDEGEGRAVSEAIDLARSSGSRLEWEGPVPPAGSFDRMSRASIYVLPAVNEPYPMSVLEAMSAGLPVIVTESCGLASFVRDTGSGLVVGSDDESLVAGIRQLLLQPDLAAQLGASGRVAVQSQRNMDSIAARLEIAYAR